MIKLVYLNKVAPVILFLTAISCQGIWVLDPIDPRLPKYTEQGNNVAGAYINNQIWESVVSYSFPYGSNQPDLIIYSTDSLVFRFPGDVNDKNVIMEFHLKGFVIKDIKDLILLANNKIQLDGKENTGVYQVDYTQSFYSSSADIGQVYFKKVEIYDDDKKAILSGTFGFTVMNSEGEKIEISYGRFDYKFSNERNFSYFD